MALAHTLSALKSLILEIDSLPLSAQERQVYFARTFPNLTPLECEDLSRIPPPSLAQYSRLIFAGMTSTLKTHFPLTFSSLYKNYHEQDGERFSPLQFVQTFSRHYPWKSTTTEYLARTFVDYLHEIAPLSFPQSPEILDIAKFELSKLLLRRKVLPPQPPSLTYEELAAHTIEEILQFRWELSPYVMPLSVTSPVLELTSHDKSTSLNERSSSQRTVLLIRQSDGTLLYRYVADSLQKLFMSATPSGALEEFAQACIEERKVESEEMQLSYFFSLLISYIQDGILVVTPQK